MANYTVNLLLVNLHIAELSVGYSPPVGPAMDFRVAYNAREVFQPQIPAYSNLGPELDVRLVLIRAGRPGKHGAERRRLPEGGRSGNVLRNGVRDLEHPIQEPRHRSAHLIDKLRAAVAWRDGRGLGAARRFHHFPWRVYLTAIRDPQGNTATFAYSYESTTGRPASSKRDRCHWPSHHLLLREFRTSRGSRRSPIPSGALRSSSTTPRPG